MDNNGQQQQQQQQSSWGSLANSTDQINALFLQQQQQQQQLGMSNNSLNNNNINNQNNQNNNNMMNVTNANLGLTKQDTMSSLLLNEDWLNQRAGSFSNLGFLRQSMSSQNSTLSSMIDPSNLVMASNPFATSTTNTSLNMSNPYVNNNNNNNHIISPQNHHNLSNTTTTTTTTISSITNNNPLAQQQQNLNTSINMGDLSSSPMKQDSQDNYDEVGTPPTPPVYHASTPPIMYTNSFIRNSSTSMQSDKLAGMVRDNSGIYENSEYESQPKLQRTNTQIYDAQMMQLPQNSLGIDIKVDQFSFLRSQTEKLENDHVERFKQSNSNLSNGSFLINNYQGTGTEKISQEFYNGLITRYHERNDRFLKAKDQQVRVMQTNDLAMANELQKTYIDMKKHIDEEKMELKNLLSKTILQPNDLHQIRETIEGLKSHHRIVDVLFTELQFILNKKKPESCCALVLLSQAPSQVIFIKKNIPDPYKVELVTGVLVPESVSPISAKLEKSDTTSKKEKSTPPMENFEVQLDKSNRATFPSLKINLSTRMTPTALKFTAVVKDRSAGRGSAGKTIESVPTNPILVITNESQWAEAAGKILIGEAFEDKEEITWELFANILHSQVFVTTGQSPFEPKRKLHTWEFDYIQQNLFGSKTKIIKKDVNEFWDKFGLMLQTIHFKRHISSLWFDGLIYGLISKNECKSILYNEPEGSFLIRFSESLPGSFAVAYVTTDESDRVKHFLVKPEEIGANKTLPDYLGERFQFKILYKVDPKLKKLSPVEKDIAFKDFYSKRLTKKGQQTGNPGYVSGL